MNDNPIKCKIICVPITETKILITGTFILYLNVISQHIFENKKFSLSKIKLK